MGVCNCYNSKAENNFSEEYKFVRILIKQESYNRYASEVDIKYLSIELITKGL